MAACHVSMGKKIKGSGIIIKEIRNVHGFTKLESEGQATVVLQQGQEFKVEVETDDNIMPYVDTRKEGDRLIISMKGDVNISNSKGINILVQMPSVQEIELEGSGSLKGVGQFYDADKLELSSAGSGNIAMSVKSPSIDVSIAGSGSVDLNGETRDLDISIGGSGDYHGENLKGENVKVSIGGSGTAKVFASVNLDISVAGSGDIYYKGSPNITKSIVGSGTVKSLQ